MSTEAARSAPDDGGMSTSTLRPDAEAVVPAPRRAPARAGAAPAAEPALPTVSVVVPVFDEEGFAGRCVASVLAQDYPAGLVEVLVVDGRSTDGTRAEVLAAAAAAPDRVRLLDNPARIVPAAMNVGLAHAGGDVVVRVDGHAALPPGYVSRCVAVLAATGADCVGGVIETVSAEDGVGRAIAAAQSSRFGVGDVAFRTGRADAGPADTVPFGAYPRSVFDRIGGYDEELACNEDDELNLRLLRSGGVVWFDPSISAEYVSRPTLGGLWRQYFRYGRYKVRVAQKRGGFGAVRHVVPATFVTATALSLLLAAIRRDPRWALAVLGPYAAAMLPATAQVAHRSRVRPDGVAAAFAVLHTSYGVGFLTGAWHWRRGFRHR